VHLLKLHAWPDDGPAAHWRAETIGFLADAQARFTPAMWQRISLDALYRKALQQVRAPEPGDQPPRELPAMCPFVLDDLLADDIDMPGLMAKLR
jgi:hypothetical protein